jgi:Na+/H+ antiporter
MRRVELVLTLVAVTLVVIVVARLCEPIRFPAPLALLAVGILASVAARGPLITLSPDVVLFGLLPPLLYAAAIGTSLFDVKAHLTPILGLSFGLVLFTAFGVGLVAWWLLPVPFPVAFALGAIVAPPDAVAATAVARGIGLPRNITTILEGESLLNDATALVSLRTAVAAAGLAVGTHEQVTGGSVARDFAWAVAGGIGIGVVVFLVVGFIRRQLTSTAADTALSYAVPFAAYAPAEHVHASGVLAVVIAGLLLAHRAPVLQSAPSRLSERVNWASITFLLENAVFLLIGLQMWGIVRDVVEGPMSTDRGLLVSVAVLAAVLLLRPAYMIPFTLLTNRRQGDLRTRLRSTLVGSWAGMRGVVTLAAALSLPVDTPQRPTLILVALVVTVGTLLLQGTTLPAVARALDVRGPDPREDALQEAMLVQATTGAGLRAIESEGATEPGARQVVETIRTQATMRVNRVWERLGQRGDGAAETPSETYRRLRLTMLTAERDELLRVRTSGGVDSAILDGVLRTMDAEESALAWSADRQRRLDAAELRTPEAVAGACEHLAAAGDCATPRTPEGCAECLRAGTSWVHLRVCLACGHVGCCDSSPGRHASAHYAASGHPVMRSLEPGEVWRWCFVDEVLG